MGQYYYFAASLPSVWMDKEIPISHKEFMSQAKENLSKADYRDLEKATFTPSDDKKIKSPVVRAWASFNYKLSEILTEERSKRLGWDKDKKYKAKCPDDPVLREKVKKIVEKEDPLKAERDILSLYFDFLSKYREDSPFSTEALMIYSLKLQIKEREKEFSDERGEKEFNRLLGHIQKEIFK